MHEHASKHEILAQACEWLIEDKWKIRKQILQVLSSEMDLACKTQWTSKFFNATHPVNPSHTLMGWTHYYARKERAIYTRTSVSVKQPWNATLCVGGAS